MNINNFKFLLQTHESNDQHFQSKDPSDYDLRVNSKRIINVKRLKNMFSRINNRENAFDDEE